jgi:hypothetical protein
MTTARLRDARMDVVAKTGFGLPAWPDSEEPPAPSVAFLANALRDTQTLKNQLLAKCCVLANALCDTRRSGLSRAPQRSALLYVSRGAQRKRRAS